MSRRGAAAATVVLGLATSSCGGGDEERAGSCPNASGGSGEEQVFRLERVAATPVGEAGVRSTIELLCRRFREAGVGGARIRREGAGNLSIRAERPALVLALTRVGDLRFYDWEPNVLGPRGPDRPYVGAGARDQAIRVAAGQRPRAEATDLPAEGVADEIKRRFGGDQRKVRAHYDAVNDARGQPARVPRGIALVEAERAPGQPERIERLFVIEDDSELLASHLRDAEGSADPATGAPVVKVDFTPAGRRAFASLTRRVARRGAGGPPQRFAVILDGAIVTLPTIDPRSFPNGLDGRAGASIAGLPRADTQALPVLLSTGPLPLRLVPTGRG